MGQRPPLPLAVAACLLLVMMSSPARMAAADPLKSMLDLHAVDQLRYDSGARLGLASQQQLLQPQAAAAAAAADGGGVTANSGGDAPPGGYLTWEASLAQHAAFERHHRSMRQSRWQSYTRLVVLLVAIHLMGVTYSVVVFLRSRAAAGAAHRRRTPPKKVSCVFEQDWGCVDTARLFGRRIALP